MISCPTSNLSMQNAHSSLPWNETLLKEAWLRQSMVISRFLSSSSCIFLRSSLSLSMAPRASSSTYRIARSLSSVSRAFCSSSSSWALINSSTVVPCFFASFWSLALYFFAYFRFLAFSFFSSSLVSSSINDLLTASDISSSCRISFLFFQTISPPVSICSCSSSNFFLSYCCSSAARICSASYLLLVL